MNFIKSFYRFFSPKYQNLFLEYKVNFKPRYGYGRPPHPLLYDIINKDRANYSLILNEALKYIKIFQSIKKSNCKRNSKEPVYNNKYLPGLDIIGIYTILAYYKPNKYIEVGSGTSTKVAYKSKIDNNLQTQIISIDPHPREEIDMLSDIIIRKPFEEVNYEEIFKLQENDILFIDSSHRILPNSDSLVFFLEIIPYLKPELIVHLHDVYLPYDYPQFMCDRFYSEQYGLAFYLLANPQKYQIVLPNYFIYEDKKLMKIIEPIWNHPNLQDVERHGGSFWFRIV